MYTAHACQVRLACPGEQPANMPEPMEDEEEQARLRQDATTSWAWNAGPGGLTNIALVNLGNHPAIFLETSDRHHCHL